MASAFALGSTLTASAVFKPRASPSNASSSGAGIPRVSALPSRCAGVSLRPLSGTFSARRVALSVKAAGDAPVAKTTPSSPESAKKVSGMETETSSAKKFAVPALAVGAALAAMLPVGPAAAAAVATINQADTAWILISTGASRPAVSPSLFGIISFSREKDGHSGPGFLPFSSMPGPDGASPRTGNNTAFLGFFSNTPLTASMCPPSFLSHIVQQLSSSS